MGITTLTALDFETANSKRSSPCSVGMVKFDPEAGQMIDRCHILIDPQMPFEDRNISIHGITPEDVAGKPTWDCVFDFMEDFIGDDLIVAHNASFERSVINQTCDHFGIFHRDFHYVCTVKSSKSLVPKVLENYKLHTVHRYYFPDYDTSGHHDAFWDAYASARIATRQTMNNSFQDLIDCGTLGMSVPRKATPTKTTSMQSKQISQPADPSPISLVSSSAEFDPTSLQGLTICITGRLSMGARGEYAKVIRLAGGVWARSMKKSVDYLVYGTDSIEHFAPGEIKSSKYKQAEKWGIKIISEQEFVNMLITKH